MRNATSQQPSELPAVQSPSGRQCHPFTIRLISQNPLTVTMTRIVSRAGIKATSCDSHANGSAVLILGQALLTLVTAVTFLQESAGKVHFVFKGSKEDQRVLTVLMPHLYSEVLDPGIPVNLTWFSAHM